MHLQQGQHTPRGRSGRKGFWEMRRKLAGWGFDLSTFKCEEEFQFATHFIEERIIDSTPFKALARFGVTPAWLIGESGPFIEIDGMQKLLQAFELGEQLGMDTSRWIEHRTSVEVIKMLPSLYN